MTLQTAWIPKPLFQQYVLSPVPLENSLIQMGIQLPINVSNSNSTVNFKKWYDNTYTDKSTIGSAIDHKNMILQPETRYFSAAMWTLAIIDEILMDLVARSVDQQGATAMAVGGFSSRTGKIAQINIP